MCRFQDRYNWLHLILGIYVRGHMFPWAYITWAYVFMGIYYMGICFHEHILHGNMFSWAYVFVGIHFRGRVFQLAYIFVVLLHVHGHLYPWI